ncbi:hypothetical protein [Nocardia sp. N2S4-5]|uniref:terpene synthase family protein n=1 Tax=Nocardia sp. N2S4-5 TaxID=3351565 RepID=UPI0037D872D6
MDRFLEDHYIPWDAMVFPTAPVDRVLELSCVTSLFFAIDDLALVEQALFERVERAWQEQHPYGRAFADIFGRLRSRMRPHVWERFVARQEDWFQYTAEENSYRSRNEFPDLENYRRIREQSIGMYSYIVLLEYLHDLDLGSIGDDPDLAQAARLTCDHITLTNDLLSMRKEILAGDEFNSVLCVMRDRGISLQSAVYTVCDLAAEDDRQLTQLSDDLRLRYRGHPAEHDLGTVLDGLGLLRAGNLGWSWITPRYHGPGYRWTGMTSGYATFGPNRTLWTRCPQPSAENVEAHEPALLAPEA